MKKVIKALLRKKRKNETWFGYVLAVSHLWLGLLSSLVVFAVCLTGSIYAFKNPIMALCNRDKISIEIPADKRELSLDLLQQQLSAEGKVLTSLVLPDNRSKSILISYSEAESGISRSSYFNPYTAEELGVEDRNLAHFFQVILQIHRNLMLSQAGKQLVGASVLIMVFLLISGLVLWMPKKWKWNHVRPGLRIQWNAGFKRINYDLHKTLGFYSLTMLLCIALTGLYVSYPWMKNVIIIGLGGEAVSGDGANQQISASFESKLQQMMERQLEKNELKDVKAISLDSLLVLTHQKLPYTGTILIHMPDKEDPRFRVKKLNNHNWLGAITPDFVSFDKKGELKSLELFKEKALHKQFIDISLPLHTGEIFGLPGIILYALISLTGCSLPVSGFIIWFNKVNKFK